jgi:serine/threonine protein kinase
MDYCEQGDLYTRIRQDKDTQIDEDIILDWVSQILISLEYLHANKVIHRDLKTQNIFMSKDTLFLGDFGISKRLDNTQDLANTYIGTPYYMSPELFNYQSYSFKSDIWSLGCVIYEICNRNHAFSAQSINGLAVKILKGDYNPLNEFYSQELRDLIISLLQVEQDARPSLEDIMSQQLFNTRIVYQLQRMMNSDSLTFDKLVAVEEQIQRLQSKNVFKEDNMDISNLFEKIHKRKEILLKEKNLESIISKDMERTKSNYSNNFEIEFDSSIDSCLSQNLDYTNQSRISYEVEALKENENIINQKKSKEKKLFEKKKKTDYVEEINENHFEESFEKDLSFEEFKLKDTSESKKKKEESHFTDLITSKIEDLQRRLILYLGKEKFEEIMNMYDNYEESDINFKTNIESKEINI